MKVKFLSFILFSFSCLSFAQVIKGKVVNSLHLPLSGASIYYEGSTISAITNENGEFSLTTNPKLKIPIIISYLGYQTVALEIFDTNKELLIVLENSVATLKEVIIKKNRFSRKEMMKVFRERFLGQTPFGKKTIIKNEDEIEFDYDEKKCILFAYSDKPLQIINPSLGYSIYYELVDFYTKFTKLTIEREFIYQSFYSGYSRFEEIDNDEKKIRNRKKAYEGSITHFFRNLIANKWGKDGFQLFIKSFLVIPDDYFTVIQEDDIFKIEIKKQKNISKVSKDTLTTFTILFNNKEQSRVQFAKEFIYVDLYGNNLNLLDVMFSGAISIKCVGEMLPLNFGM
jgi:hypothetical protein